MGKRGAAASNKTRTKAERSALARKAAKAHWNKLKHDPEARAKFVAKAGRASARARRHKQVVSTNQSIVDDKKFDGRRAKKAAR